MGAAARTPANNLPEINTEWCKGCGICVAFCPRECLSLENGGKVKLDAEKCGGCGICEMYCPDFAILIKEAGRSGVRGKTPADAGQ